MLEALCTERFSIVPEDIVEADRGGEFARLPIGTGPFRMVENISSMLVLEANESYFEGCPHLDRIEMWVWPNYEGYIGTMWPLTARMPNFATSKPIRREAVRP
ncbi:MarR-like DNA-binding transcriptional regulator SgrR of sgrS sRNA [Paenibacillus phyllosphaerae]|uniref:MarR-like DNA-binding transcriptional regulator SgrR of sgrS sRNA n=1 Tax=Paenibacillus phyllosphaerae TaxID=274593 RepID=A0A7W5AWW3_9BACL|nr:MarR-like DNA-binding transcriptional regulator SgrR of sgrS sRNA [Paenibacillus phyllosphaerae]